MSGLICTANGTPSERGLLSEVYGREGACSRRAIQEGTRSRTLPRVSDASAAGIERRTDPRRGVITRVGLVLTATGIASAAIDRRSLAGVAADVPLAVGFGLFVGILLLGTFRRPPRAATWIALAAVALVYLLAAAELASSLLGMTAFM